MVIDPTAGDGDITNLAFASGTLVGFGHEVQSNIASHTLDVDNDAGVFSKNGVVLGKVFLDCNGDGQQQNETEQEPGIPGVMLHTQSGLSVVTDEVGSYSLQALPAKTHVLDVYEPSLPAGGTVALSRAMDALSPGSRIVPLQAGEIRTEDFAVSGCATETVSDVSERIERALARIEGISLDVSKLSLEAAAPRQRREYARQAEGLEIAASRRSESPANDLIAQEIDSETLLAQAAPELAFLGLETGDQLTRPFTSVRVTGPSDAELQLTLNGEPVDASRLGRRLSENGVQLLEYVSLDLVAGENEFSLSAMDPFGNVRDQSRITITAPGKAAGLSLSAPETALANPAKPVALQLQLVDAEGRAVESSAEVTLLPGEDKFDVRDVSDQVPGQQVFLADGHAKIDLIPSGRVGTRTVRVTSPLGGAEVDIQFIADTGEAGIAVGYIEGAANLNDPDAVLGIVGPDHISPFEQTQEGVEASVYLKGEVLEDTLLTLRYESDKVIEEELFRSDEPDEFYPVYGDRSSRGYDAQSSGKGFLMLERDTSYAMVGDVNYAASASAFQLGRYQRSLRGGLAHVETGKLRVDGYYGRTDTGQVVIEIPALGISGPYDLGFGDVVKNSELVELVTRDREQPDVIIKTERLSRFSAYTLDYFARTLIFTRPIASRDEAFNPVSIRVTFETHTGSGERYDVYGAEAAFDLTDWMTFGARHLTSDAARGTDDRRTVRAAYADIAIGDASNLQVEVADTENGFGQSGQAARFSFERATETGSLGVRAAMADEAFDAPGASIRSGREEARLHANHRIGKSGLLSGEAIYSNSKQTDAERLGVVGRYEAALNDQVRLRAGSRLVTESRDGEQEDAATVIAGLVWTPEWLKGGAVDLEAEQEITDGSASRVAIGADYTVTPKWRMYAQGEYSGSRSGEFGLTEAFNEDVSLRAGSEYRFADNISAFSEYRASRSFFDAGVAQGLTANWAISPALSTRARIEHVQPIGDEYPRNTAAGIGFTVEPEKAAWIVDADLDFSAGESGRQTWYGSTTWGRKWYDVTLLARNRFAISDSGDDTRTRDRLRVGMSHRPKDDSHLNTLVWYEFAHDGQEQSRENRHIWSAGGEQKSSSNLRVRGRLAGQYYSFTGGPAGIDVDEVSLLAQAGTDRDFGERWNVAVNVAAITDGDFNDQTLGAGAEANYVVKKNTVVGLGYNYTEATRESLKGLYRTGMYVRMRLKFDQSLWNIFNDSEF